MLKTRLVTLTVASIAAAFAIAPAAHAADDYFLKIDGLAGEATAGPTKEVIAIQSFQLGIENQSTIGSKSGGAGGGKAQFSTLTIEKTIDSTTPMFMQRVALGQHFTGMELVARKAGGAANGTYMRWSFQPVYVTSQKHTGASGDDAPTETLTFLFGAMQQNYTKQAPDGKPVGNVITVWNQVSNSDNPILPGETNTFAKSRFL
jgi:type VI secretion system secreted protein Hcp